MPLLLSAWRSVNPLNHLRFCWTRWINPELFNTLHVPTSLGALVLLLPETILVQEAISHHVGSPTYYCRLPYKSSWFFRAHLRLWLVFWAPGMNYLDVQLLDLLTWVCYRHCKFNMSQTEHFFFLIKTSTLLVFSIKLSVRITVKVATLGSSLTLFQPSYPALSRPMDRKSITSL